MFLLPNVREDKRLSFDHFPSHMHAVIFRLWETVACDRIAKVLKTQPDKVEAVAFDMGLKKQPYLDEWLQKGYITILKSVWHLLPYDQILELLDWDEERLAYILKEDDFLSEKLGGFKPYCEPILYHEPTAEESRRAKEIGATLSSCVDTDTEKDVPPFHFFEKMYDETKTADMHEVRLTDEWYLCDKTDHPDVAMFLDDFRSETKERFGIDLAGQGSHAITVRLDASLSDDDEYHEIDIRPNGINIRAVGSVGILRALYYLCELTENSTICSFCAKSYKRTPQFKTRYIYSFCGLYGDVLDAPGEISFPDSLLKQYAKLGINGVWIQGVLYKLTVFPFDPTVSDGWKMRLENLRKLTERGARYGIKFYLYLNEPRCMPNALFEKFPHIKGQTFDDGMSCMCTMTEEVQAYLKNSLQSLIRAVPRIGGFFCISMSENRTNCYSRSKWIKVNCPRCSRLRATDVVATTVATMANAVREVDPNVRFFAWDWAWNGVFGEDEVDELIAQLPQNVIMQCVSENGKNFEIGGVSGFIDDYSLSIEGPSDATKRVWSVAKKLGHERCAKVQINNSWECSTVTFLPVYDTIRKHMQNLVDEHVEHIMLSWTLGGYPSDNIRMAAGFFFKDESSDPEKRYDEILTGCYGEHAETIKAAASCFSRAFAEFPFNICVIYHGPQNLGPANLLFEKPSGFDATMTGYPYDHLASWRAIYPEEVYVSQFRKLSGEWEKGLEQIRDIPVCAFKDMAFYGYSLFRSSYLQSRFCQLRDDPTQKDALCDILKREKALAVQNHAILKRNSTVGYEAANHYYVSKHMLLEKIIQCDYLAEHFS